MKMISLSRILLLLLVLPLSAQAGDADSDRLPDPRAVDLSPSQRLEELLERVRYEHTRLETLEADFVQYKESSMLVEVSESTGVFSYAAPDKVRWEYLSPNPISLLIAGDEMTTWYQDLGQAEKTKVGRHSERVMEYLGAGSSMDTLLEYFAARLAVPEDPAAPYRVELTPRFARIARRLEEMSLWIDSEHFMPVRLRYVEPDGDVTDYRFENLRINGELPDDRFLLELPSDTDVRVIDLERRTASR